MTKPIPEGIRSITPAMTIDGCAAAIDLYKKAFGAVEIDRAPDPSGKKVWHAHIKIGDSAVFVNDVFPAMGGAPNHSSLWIYTDNVDAAFKRAVDAGLEVKMPLTDMFWGDRMGSLKDRWGNSWTLAQRVKDMTPDETKKAAEKAAAEWQKNK
jgi:PhnB protein